MSLRAWWSRLRGSLRRDDGLEREMRREMEFHVDMATRRNVERGMTEPVARRQAKLDFGASEEIKEVAREAHRARGMEMLLADLRFALRSLRRSPAFTLAALLTVALGIGVSTAMFTVVNAVLLRPLPIPKPNDFTYVGWVWAKGNDIPSLTAFQYEFVRDHGRGFEAVATYRSDEADPADQPGATPLRGLRVSGGFFRTLGFTPRLGREFAAAELQEGGPAVVILSDAVWRTRFAADPGILQRQVRLHGESRTVVGVLPAEFRFPPVPDHTGYLLPLALPAANPGDEGHNSDVIARLEPGTSDVARQTEIEALSSAFRTAYPSLAPKGESFKLYSHEEVYVGPARSRLLWVLFGAVSLVLLIACANTATLLLVRATARQHEIAVRASLGAGPIRILRQLLTEGLALSLVAAAIGVLLSIATVRTFVATAPAALPAGTELGIDGRVLGYAIALSVLTGLGFGLTAAVPAFRARLSSTLLGSSRGTTGGRGTRLRGALVALEIAVAVVLLASATLLTTSFVRLINVDAGFEPERVLAVRLGRLPPGYDAARREALVERLLQRARALPGVESAASTPNLPLERGQNFPVDIAGHPELAVGAVEMRAVSPGYFATLGIRLRSGRDFDERDREGGEPVAIVNEAFARHFWKDAPPLGRTIQIGHYKDRWLAPGLEHQTSVIGVAADIHEIGLDRNARPTVLLPRSQAGEGKPLLVVRGSAELIPALRAALSAEEPLLTPQVERLSAVVSRSVAAPRFRTLLIGSFAGFALLLAGIGIYGVVASVVQQRQREIGIRIALGAGRAAVAMEVVRRCFVNVLTGAVVGIAAFWAARKVLSSMLYGISPGDPRVFAITVVVLALVVALATWIPARRATTIDPATSLRLE